MEFIDVKKIIKQRGLDFKEVAMQLFPDNKHPRLALNRVIAGEAVLDATQISKLALMADLTVSELYNEGPWKSKAYDNIIVFTNGDYHAELDRNNWQTKLFHKHSMFHEFILHSNSIPLNEYVEILNNQILKYINDEQNQD